MPISGKEQGSQLLKKNIVIKEENVQEYFNKYGHTP